MEHIGVSGGQRLPKNFITPWVLLVLKQWSLHGYMILQQLNRMGFSGIDHTTLYRELRRMESWGIVALEWETGESGPARRVYRITDAGEEMLLGWTEVVSGYQRMITGFFDLYAQVSGSRRPRRRRSAPILTLPRRVRGHWSNCKTRGRPHPNPLPEGREIFR